MISETNGRTDERANERMKIEKRGVGRPLLGPAKMRTRQFIVRVKAAAAEVGNCNNQNGFKLQDL